MNFSELLTKLGNTAVTTLASAKSTLAEAVAGLTAAVAQIGELETKLSSVNTQLSESSAAHGKTSEELATVKADLATAQEQAATAVTGTIAILAQAGIKVEKLDADSLKAAASARAEALGQELLAARGSKPLPEAINSSEAEAKVDISTPEKLLAHYESLALGTPERAAFFKANEQAIWAAWSKSK